MSQLIETMRPYTAGSFWKYAGALLALVIILPVLFLLFDGLPIAASGTQLIYWLLLVLIFGAAAIVALNALFRQGFHAIGPLVIFGLIFYAFILH